MRETVFPLWVFAAVAIGIAVAAFLVGQLKSGAGVIVVGVGSVIWTAYVARRGAIARRSGIAAECDR